MANSEKISRFMNSVQKQDFSSAKNQFNAIMAEKIDSALENKKIDIATRMASSKSEE